MTPEEIEQQRDQLAGLVPDAILAIARCLKKPARNAQVQLAAAKTILDRAGLPEVKSSEITGKGGSEFTITVRDLADER